MFHKSKSLPDDFKKNVDKILTTLSEATKRDRQSSGNKVIMTSSVGMKRKRDDEGEACGDTGPTSDTTDYFFAKFLTSPDLLDLQVCSA